VVAVAPDSTREVYLFVAAASASLTAKRLPLRFRIAEAATASGHFFAP
jgi:hypothetical protein